MPRAFAMLAGPLRGMIAEQETAAVEAGEGVPDSTVRAEGIQFPAPDLSRTR
jgi:hypothetical protein